MTENIKMNKQAMTTESGRSMVEMLGVLAIVGVLSIGGIAGYQYAMNKHRASTILYTVSEMAVTGAGQLLGGNELTLTEFGTHIDGTYEFGFNGDYSGTETDFSIIVYDIPQAVCQHIQNSEFTMPYLRLMNDSDNGTCDEGMNTAEFVFKDSLQSSDNASTTCPTGTSTSGTGGVAKKLENGIFCKCPENLVYTANGCVENKEGKNCSSYETNECGLGYYCQTSYPQQCTGGTGICQPVSNVGSTTVSGHLATTSRISWWSGYSWCLGNGKSGYMPVETLTSTPEIRNHSLSFWSDTGYECGGCYNGCSYHSHGSGTGREAIHHGAICAN